MYNFQKEFKKVVLEAEEMPMEIFCALTNSNIKFISSSRALVDKVKTSCILKEDEIMNALCYNTLMKNFAQISGAAFARIEQVLFSQITLRMNESNFKKMNLERLLTSAMEPINIVIQMLMPSYAKKMWKNLFEFIAISYVVKYLKGVEDYKPSNLNEFVDKMIKERTFLKDVFEANVPAKDLHECLTTIRLFEKACIEPQSEIVELLHTMAQRLREKHTTEYIKWLSKARPSDFTTRERQELERRLEGEKFFQNVKGKNGKRDLLLDFYKHTMREINKYKFIRRLKRRVIEYRELRYLKAQQVRKAMEADVKNIDTLVGCNLISGN